MSTVICPACKNHIAPDANACPKCGHIPGNGPGELGKCPHCSEMIAATATKCPHCGGTVTPRYPAKK